MGNLINRTVLAFFSQIMKFCLAGLNDPAKRKELAVAFAAKYDIPVLNEEQEEAVAELVLSVVSLFVEKKGAGDAA